ncbi:MAG TPA: phosphatase PAP2 family protein [Anaerolineales bacterium]|nr:phosphatase PAP2 family protein [Anaerolineales bacterium]
MQPIIDSGIALVLALQSAGDWLVAPMQFFSQLGTEDFFFIVLPLIYWSIDAGLGVRVGMILAVGNVFNYIGKLAFAGPRPYWVSSDVRAWWPETSFGAPSGHAQHAMSVWGIIAASRREGWVRAICILLIFMIGFSRIYLGAHFPHDVVLGWLIGGLILWAFIRYWDAVAAWLAGKTFRQQVWTAFIVSMIFVAAGWAVTAPRSDFQVPEMWMDNARLAGTELPAPVDLNGVFTSAGSFFGLAAGLAWINSRGGYQADGPVWKRIVRYAVGLVGVLILWMGLGAVFPRGDDLLVYVLRFVRYTLVGWWVTGGAPWVFLHFKLTTSSSPRSSI